MRKTSILLSSLVLAAMVLAACGGGATSTNVVSSPPPITAESTETMPATEMPTEVGTATEPGVPVTGDINPARVSNQLDFMVVDQDGNQVGDVEDMVLDLTNTNVSYVIVNTTEGRSVVVPWNLLSLQTGTGGAVSTPSGDATAVPEATSEGAATSPATEAPTGAATEAPTAEATGEAGVGIATGENVFILQTDASLLSTAPEFDPSALPALGQVSADWDADIRSFWESGGASGGAATAVPEATAEGAATSPATEAPTGAATEAATATEPATQGTGPQALQGVMLASEVLGSTITLGAGQATMEPGATTEPGAATTVPGQATTEPGVTAEATASPAAGADTDLGSMTATIEDVIVDTDLGDILYLVVSSTFDDGEHMIPVPFSMFQWDPNTSSFMLAADGTMLQNAPFFQSDQFPDTSMEGWNSEFDSFWQSGGAGGGAGGGEATATP